MDPGKVKLGELVITKVPGTLNPADVFTKYLPRPDMARHMQALAVEKQAGRAESAPQITGSSNTKGE